MKLTGMTDGVKVISSIDRHDYVSVGDIMHDGGQPGTHEYSGYNRYRGEHIYFEVPQTYGELYTDYQINYNNRERRSYGVWDIENIKILDESVDDTSSFEYEVSQTIWGTRGVNGDLPKKFVNLVDCSTSHLNAILDTQIISDNLKKIIEHILNTRQIKS